MAEHRETVRSSVTSADVVRELEELRDSLEREQLQGRDDLLATRYVIRGRQVAALDVAITLLREHEERASG